jgi:hypothetical protein
MGVVCGLRSTPSSVESRRVFPSLKIQASGHKVQVAGNKSQFGVRQSSIGHSQCRLRAARFKPQAVNANFKFRRSIFPEKSGLRTARSIIRYSNSPRLPNSGVFFQASRYRLQDTRCRLQATIRNSAFVNRPSVIRSAGSRPQDSSLRLLTPTSKFGVRYFPKNRDCEQHAALFNIQIASLSLLASRLWPIEDTAILGINFS